MYKFSNSFTEFTQKEINENSKEYFIEILSLLNDKFDLNHFNPILKKFKIERVEDIKLDSLDLLISYANFILKDNIISEIEIQDFSILKRIFRIKEGDFKKFKNFEINEILKKEFMRIYSDNYVNDKEQLINLNLQSLFDLSYDEFENIKKDEVILSLIQGANPTDLDISKIPKGFIL
ncbi:hypothetical protein [Chryseobacterium sp. FH1]|uniref:hypothetical protein n=1 Tax=Chryseobacterium sp. FH1 TaxID=1233951 RepID=UPI0004E32E97|nr:hypothetical protein [Chryseobacterium sp. FH1]KFC22476.1 hypothetical protein IO90_05950 [Chryseobacterium sp. FH1]